MDTPFAFTVSPVGANINEKIFEKRPNKKSQIPDTSPCGSQYQRKSRTTPAKNLILDPTQFVTAPD
jgi:hypothetical protein